jgi:hypothetical protein
MPRLSPYAPEDLPKQRRRQVALGQLSARSKWCVLSSETRTRMRTERPTPPLTTTDKKRERWRVGPTTSTFSARWCRRTPRPETCRPRARAQRLAEALPDDPAVRHLQSDLRAETEAGCLSTVGQGLIQRIASSTLTARGTDARAGRWAPGSSPYSFRLAFAHSGSLSPQPGFSGPAAIPAPTAEERVTLGFELCWTGPRRESAGARPRAGGKLKGGGVPIREEIEVTPSHDV